VPTVDDCIIIKFKHDFSKKGYLTPIEFRDIPFVPKRIFYVHGVKQLGDLETRGNHAHRETKQLIICLNSWIKVTVDDGNAKKEHVLDSPFSALYIAPMIWDTYIMSDDMIMIVLADTYYDKKDYIYNYEEFKRIAND
jgi:hypothetical protein